MRVGIRCRKAGDLVNARAAAAARTRTQRSGKHLAVHASELAVQSDFQILRRYRQPLLLRLERTHRPTLEDHVHRATRLGSSRSLNLRIGIKFDPGVLFLAPEMTSACRLPRSREGSPNPLCACRLASWLRSQRISVSALAIPCAGLSSQSWGNWRRQSLLFHFAFWSRCRRFALLPPAIASVCR